MNHRQLWSDYRDYILIVVALFLWGIGEGMFFYFQPLYMQSLGANPVAIGAILSATGVVMTVSQIPAGYLTDRLGRRPFIWASWILALTAAWVMALAQSLEVFVAGIILYFFTAFGGAAQNSYVASAGARLSVGRALTLVSAFFNAGTILGALIGGYLGDLYGYQPIYRTSAIIFVAATFLILFIRTQPVEPHTEGQKRLDLFKNRSFLLVLGVILVAITAAYLPQPLAQNYLQNVHHLTLTEIGQLGAIGSLGNALILLVFGRMRAPLAFGLGQVLMGVFSLLLWQGQGLAWFGVAYFCLGGFRLARAMTLALARPLVPLNQIGLAFGVVDTANNSAIILAPILAGVLFEINPSLVFAVGLGAIGVGVLVTIFGLRQWRS